MKNYKLEIFTNEDLDLIENLEEREEAQENYEDEIEAVYQFLKFKNIEFEQVTDNIFSLNIDTYKSRNDNEIIEDLEIDLKMILEQKDIATFNIENYVNA